MIKNNISMKIKYILKDYYDLIFLAIYIFSLPISHIASIQSISIVLFILVFFLKNHSKVNYKTFLTYKVLILSMLITLVLALISLLYTPDFTESLKEIKGELINSFILLIIFFYYSTIEDEKKMSKLLFIIFTALATHTLLNILIWLAHGGFPYRSGGLLDSGGGERFGIWTTYSLAIFIAWSKFKSKYIGMFFVIISIISIIANNTRATYIALLVIAVLYTFLFAKSVKIKIIAFVSIILAVFLFYSYSKHLNSRFNIQQTISNIEYVFKISPSNFGEINIESSTKERLSMWKSVILYRIKEPFIPTEYGRFLYAKSIKKKFENLPENIPYKIFPQTHNDFIGTLYSLGIIGLLAMIYFLYFNLKISYTVYKKSQIIPYKIYGMFIFIGTVGYIVSMMFGSFFADSEAKFFYPLYGIILGIYYKTSHKET